MIFSGNKTTSFGLDISDRSIKAFQLKKAGEHTKIQAFGRYRLPEGLIVDGMPKDYAELSKNINKLLSKPIYGSFTTNSVVASLPESRTFIKLISIDKSPNNIADLIGAELEKHIPLTAKEIYYDWQIIKEKKDSFDILIGAAPKGIVNSYIELLRGTKLTISALETGSVAMCRCLLPEENKKYNGPLDKNYALIDIGAMNSNLTVYSKGTIALSVSIPISSEAATDEISKTLEIKREQAEKAKLICGLDKSQAHGIVADILSSLINSLINRMEISIDYYNSHYGNRGPVSEIIITGGGSNIKDLDKLIHDKIAVTTVVGNIFTNLNEDTGKFSKWLTPVNDPESKNNLPATNMSNNGLSYAPAIGLALRSIIAGKS